MTKPPTTNAREPSTAPPADGEYPFRYTARLANVIETRWQTYWDQHHTFVTPNPGDPGFDSDKPKFYCLDMFPYPSGVGLHVGHPLGYIATDILCRYKRMRGFNVLHPMGFDAFGLPAEQFAVEHGIHPRVTTERNIANMVRQLKAIGLSYDWGRCLTTTDASYYKWTQWVFLQLYNSYFDSAVNKARPISELRQRAPDAVLAEHRLAYMAEVPVNWCPALGTVLANEEVTSDGRSERGNHPVYKRPLNQWMLRITAYAERLAEDLELVDWPEPIKLMQRNWIGRSEGAMIEFALASKRTGHLSDQSSDQPQQRVIRVFTTRPDTVFGATYMVLAPEHPLVEQVTTDQQRDTVSEYVQLAASRSDTERQIDSRCKTGVPTGGDAINPATGEHIPIWIADYVMMGYGTGAIMAVPGHDRRDFEFAKQFGLPIIEVVKPHGAPTPGDSSDQAFTGEGVGINSANNEVSLNGLPTREAKKTITQWLESKGRGQPKVQYKLRDWLFSRQRYWGEPFPILHAADGRIVALDESELPVELPEMNDFTPHTSDDPDASPRPPLSRAPDTWKYVERDGGRFERELNTMPQWAGSCWYYLRFCDPHNDERFVDPTVERYWMGERGIDLYVGGAEHAVLHLLYARFWHKVLYDLGHVSTPEPFGHLFNQGYIQAYAYTDERGIHVDSEKVIEQDGGYLFEGRAVSRSLGKMGKSLKNAVSPDDICEQYGCDTLRLYEMYMGPLQASKPWNPRDIIGLHRFLQRVWRLAVDEHNGNPAVRDEADPAVESQLHRTIARIEQDIERQAFNTAIAALIEFINLATTAGGLTLDQFQRFALALAPFAPHIAEELWCKLGHKESLAYEPWPAFDQAMLTENFIELPVQLGGKVRAKLTIPADASVKQIEAAALADAKVTSLLKGKTVRKVVVVPGKIVNIVAD